MKKNNIIFGVILGIIFAIAIPIISQSRGDDDFIAYWSSARLLATGGNPYDQKQMADLQNRTIPGRFTDKNPLLNTWNPPWLLISLMPVGFLPYKLAFHVWSFVSTILILFSVHVTWNVINNKSNNRDFLRSLLIAFTFGPTLSLLVLGQISGIILFSLIITIYYFRMRKDLLSGVALLFTLTKPQISYFFVIYMVWVIILERRWRLIVGMLSALLLSFAVMWLILPNWISSYINLLESLPYSSVYTSTIGSFIAERTGIIFFQRIGIFLIPLYLVITYFIFKKNLLPAINFGLLISLPLSPFGFLFDQVVLIPSLIQIYYWGIKRNSKKILSIITIIIYGFINIIIVVLMIGQNMPYYYFSWIPIALFILFIYTYGIRNGKDQAPT